MLKKFLCLISFLLLLQGLCAQQTQLDSMKQAVEGMQADSIKCKSFIDIALRLYSGEESMRYGHRALALAKKLNHSWLQGQAYYSLGWCYGLNEMDQKTAFLDSARAIFTELDDAKGLGLVHNATAAIMLEYGSFEEAEAAIQKAHGYYKEVGDENRRAVCLNNWAVILNEMNKPREALPKYEEALAFRLAEKPEVPASIARVYFGLGESFKLMGDLEQAVDYYLKAYEYRKKINSVAVAEVLTGTSLLIFEAAEQGKDTSIIIQKIQKKGFPTSTSHLDSSLAIPGVEERVGFINSIKAARRKYHVLNGHYQKAYESLLEQKRFDEEDKLSAASLGAFADLKITHEKDQLKIRLLEEEVNNRKAENKLNLLWLSLGIALLALVIGFLIYKNRQKANNLLLAEVKQEQQFVSIRSMLEGQEKERARIARDLHDGLGNLLSTLKVKIEGIQMASEDRQPDEPLVKASEMIDEACTEVRKISHEMMPQALKTLGLKKALADLTLKMDSTHDFDASFQTYGVEKVLDDNTNVMLFRTVQELFNNIVKYAEAHDVLLQLTYSDNWLNIMVEDDGKGFDLHSIASNQGMGLKSIAFRTEYIGGEYEIDSRPGMGTSVSINVPLKQIQS